MPGVFDDVRAYSSEFAPIQLVGFFVKRFMSYVIMQIPFVDDRRHNYHITFTDLLKKCVCETFQIVGG